uniref:WYL domain-containing protein n=1 Tax=Pararhizobium sp. IMCC3301 TaxID=3067904 RepID=UPI00274138ED|nr:WYL domain-containing protein [Pararhizobium sp. IMCC3301]
MSINEVRFGWIEAAIRYAGAFAAYEKSAYMRIFGVSEASMSRHQLRFAEAFEAACGQEVFRRTQTGSFKGGRLLVSENADIPKRHVFDTPGLDRWLEDAMGRCFEKPKSALRVNPEPAILRTIIGAITSQRIVHIDYSSRSERRERSISPHTLVDVVGRYHVRAFDHSKNRFGDFILSRITSASLFAGRMRYVGNEKDSEWNDCENILIEAREGVLSEGVIMDFGLDGHGQRILRERRAIVPYLSDNHAEGYTSPVRVVALAKKF